MGQNYLIDTNVIIDFSQQRFTPNIARQVAEILDNTPIISAITQIELLGFSIVPQQMKDFVDVADILNISQSVIFKTIEIRRSYKIKLPDAIIAATALENNLILLTRNSSDFKKISNLKLENPYDWQNE
ncbi:MAG: type II toxin-antitoxin system VapC family toxin [Candidatus Symbiothrix sp.]|jgi:predicted nucleic acid-binding protein|nr:type II toxin-antitoxin system VapC family toxin [Candidatus Symbiothrix sp.]